jgi:hypothetical protein
MHRILAIRWEMIVDLRDHSRRSGCPSHELLADHFRALHRRLWILNATLESLPRKIEEIGRVKEKGLAAESFRRTEGESILDQDDEPDGRATVERGEKIGSWIDRWKLARLRMRADLADRRAARAIEDASESFGDALEAILFAVISRLKAEEASEGCPNSIPLRSRDGIDPGKAGIGKSCSDEAS